MDCKAGFVVRKGRLEEPLENVCVCDKVDLPILPGLEHVLCEPDARVLAQKLVVGKAALRDGEDPAPQPVLWRCVEVGVWRHKVEDTGWMSRAVEATVAALIFFSSSSFPDMIA